MTEVWPLSRKHGSENDVDAALGRGTDEQVPGIHKPSHLMLQAALPEACARKLGLGLGLGVCFAPLTNFGASLAHPHLQATKPVQLSSKHVSGRYMIQPCGWRWPVCSLTLDGRQNGRQNGPLTSHVVKGRLNDRCPANTQVALSIAEEM